MSKETVSIQVPVTARDLARDRIRRTQTNVYKPCCHSNSCLSWVWFPIVLTLLGQSIVVCLKLVSAKSLANERCHGSGQPRHHCISFGPSPSPSPSSRLLNSTSACPQPVPGCRTPPRHAHTQFNAVELHLCMPTPSSRLSNHTSVTHTQFKGQTPLLQVQESTPPTHTHL